MLTEHDLIASLMRNQVYMEEVTREMLPDDTMDILNGTRKGKSDVKTLDHIMGVSDINTRQKAKEQRIKAVTIGKTA